MKSLLSFLLFFVGCTTFSDSEVGEPSTMVDGGEGGASGSDAGGEGGSPLAGTGGHLTCGPGTEEQEGKCVIMAGQGGGGASGQGGAGGAGEGGGAGGDEPGGAGQGGGGQGGTGGNTIAGQGSGAGSGAGGSTTAGAGGDAAGAGGSTTAGAGGSTTAGAGGDAGEGGDAAGAGGNAGAGGSATAGAGGSTMAGAGGSTMAGAGGSTMAGAGGAGQGGGCNVGETLCSGTCVDTKTDENNCGACGKVCAGTCSDSKCTVSLFSSMTPNCTIHLSSSTNTELGAKFTVSAAGKATAIRFFHKADMGTSFAVNLWDAATKKNLSTALVTLQPGQTGWIEVALPAPVALAVGTTYMMSYKTEDGKLCHLAGTQVEKTVGDLTFLSDNSYYNTSGGGFPGTKNKDNYFVDVVFTAD